MAPDAEDAGFTVEGQEVELPERWRIDQKGKVDISSTSRTDAFFTAPEFANFGYWGTANLMTWNCTLANRCAFYQDGYWEGLCEVRDSSTGAKYPTGTAVAVNPDVCAWLFNNYNIYWGSETIETKTNYVQQKVFFTDLLELSYDWVIGQAGLDDAFILDAPGQTQVVTGVANLAPYTGTTTLTSTAVTGTVTNGAGVFKSSIDGTGTTIFVDSIQSTASGFATQGAMVSYSTTGTPPTTPASYNNISTALASTALTGTVTSGAGTAVILYADNNSGFWRRAKLTDAGNYYSGNWSFRAPVRRIVDFFRSRKATMIGNVCKFEMYTAPEGNLSSGTTCPTQIFMQNYGGSYDQTHNASLFFRNLQLVIPWEEPAEWLKTNIVAELRSGKPVYENFNNCVIQRLPLMSNSATTYNQVVNFGKDTPHTGLLVLIPSTYLTTQQHNPMCSLFPAVNSSTGSPVTSAYLQVGGSQIPARFYGQFTPDLARLWKAMLNIMNRDDYEAFSPCFNRLQYSQNYFGIPWELQGVNLQSDAGKGSDNTINLQFANGISGDAFPFFIYWVTRTYKTTGVNMDIEMIR